MIFVTFYLAVSKLTDIGDYEDPEIYHPVNIEGNYLANP